MKRIIYLLKVGESNQSILCNLKKNLEVEINKFNLYVEILQEGLKLRYSDYNLKREQYKAPKILKRLIRKAKHNKFFRVLGILEKDIYSKNFNFVFGIAKRRSHAALISSARLTESFYRDHGMMYRKWETKEKVEERILKEAIHELGHTFGLKHCSNKCVMRFSDSLADTDKKLVKFCASCLKQLKTSI